MDNADPYPDRELRLTDTVHRMVAFALVRAGKPWVFPQELLAENFDAVRDNVATMLMLEGRAPTRDDALVQVPQPTEWDLAAIAIILTAYSADLEALEQGNMAASIARGTISHPPAEVCHHYTHPRGWSPDGPVCGKCGAPIARS